jgi:phytoene synthase
VTTTLHPQTWESRLLSLATETHPDTAAQVRRIPSTSGKLQAAYQHCAELTAVHSKSFYLASSLLPDEKRHAMRALYAFCRVSDDIVDHPQVDPQAGLASWRERALAPEVDTDDPVVLAWSDTRRRYGIPRHYAEQLMDGVGRDLTQKRYTTFIELSAYAYGVASTVGLMSMHIIGFQGVRAIPYAIKLGVALQLTNILRDVGQDWRAGRVYLPAQELADFDLDEGDLAAGVVTNRWRDFMRFQIERNRHLYREALPGLAYLNWEGRFAVGAAAELYRAILEDIEAHDYNVFSYRAHQGGWEKLRRLPGICWRSQTIRLPSPARPQRRLSPTLRTAGQL